MKRSHTRLGLVALCVVAACNDATDPELSTDGLAEGEGQLFFSANVAATTVATLVVEVTAPDLSAPLIFNLAVVDGTASGPITIPAGSDRTIVVRAFDDQGVETHRGEATVDVVEGVNPTLGITLVPLTGEVPVEAVFGEFSVVVDPAAATVAVGQTVQLAVTILDAAGQPVAENPVWATARPAIARVDAGLVTGVLPGEAEIVASYAGVAASAVITVVEATLGQIAFRSHRDDPAGDLYLMNADGTGVVRLTTDPSGDFDPDWSPDGSRLAFWSRRDGNPEIYVMNADGSGVVRLTNNGAADTDPAWSSDDRIAFRRDRFGGNRDIYVMGADGSGVTRLTSDPGFDADPDWSPDASKIVFASDRDGEFDLYVMNGDGSGITRLTDGPGLDFNPRWSADGSKIAFARRAPGSTNDARIYVMNADGSGITALTSGPEPDFEPDWSPDGSRIVFWRACCSQSDIFVMNADGSGVVALTDNDPAIGDFDPVWRP